MFIIISYYHLLTVANLAKTSQWYKYKKDLIINSLQYHLKQLYLHSAIIL